MNNKKNSKQRRIIRVRSKIKGTGIRPRLSVYRSNKYIYAQIINDEKNITLAGISEKAVQALTDKKITNLQIALLVGEKIAEKAKKQNITTVIFDRGGYKYHGKIKALAEGARKGGLIF